MFPSPCSNHFLTRTTPADDRQPPEGPELANLSAIRGTHPLQKAADVSASRAGKGRTVSRMMPDRHHPSTSDSQVTGSGRRSANGQKAKDRNCARPNFGDGLWV